MGYDFDRIIERRNTNSLKWDVAEGELPMWVADMDFATAPEVQRAIMKRAEHGIFGYGMIPDHWNEAIVDWWKRRHNFTLEKDWLVFCTGVVPAISSIVRKMTTPAENVLLLTPVYNIFYNSVLNNGRRVIESPLVYDEGEYHIDFLDLEEKLSDPQTSLMILCNPQNPVGKIWDRETLGKIGALAAKHHVLVISDEIHCDLTDPGCAYVPYPSVSEECRQNCVVCIAPTKAFNIAGLQTAAVAIPNNMVRHKVWRALNTDEVAEPNAFAIEAAVAAFTEGAQWLDALRDYVFENKQHARGFFRDNLPAVKVVPSQATYLLWLDCSGITGDAGLLTGCIRERTGLYLSTGAQFGGNGKCFLRMNVACPRETLYEGLQRLQAGVDEYLKSSACPRD